MQWPANLAAITFWRDFSSFHKSIASVGIPVFAKNGKWHNHAPEEHLPWQHKTTITAKVSPKLARLLKQPSALRLLPRKKLPNQLRTIGLQRRGAQNPWPLPVGLWHAKHAFHTIVTSSTSDLIALSFTSPESLWELRCAAIRPIQCSHGRCKNQFSMWL